MAETTISTNNQAVRFKNQVKREYVRGGRFGPYIGNTVDSVIQVEQGLKTCSLPLVAKLDGQGRLGSQTQAGNEEALANYEYRLNPTYYRHAVLIDNEEREKSEFDLYSEARPSLMNWMMERKRDQIIQAMGAIEASGTYYNYGGTFGATGATAASAANMDTWQAANADRILYGAAKSNLTPGDHTTSLGTIDTTNDKMDADMVGLLKRMAENADPLIRPIMVNGDEPWFVLFAGSYAFRDLQADTTIAQANREARPRNVKDNPIFTGGDLLYQGVVIKKIPEIDSFIDGTTGVYGGVWGANATGDSLATGGNASSRVGIAFLCGAQAVGFGIGREAQFKLREDKDYDFMNGVGIQAKHDIKKTFYNAKQHGMVTSFHSAAADS